MNLGFHRAAAGISQEDLGHLAALHRVAVGKLERGERIPRADTLLKLANALDVDANALLEGIVWKPPQIERGSFAVEVDVGARDELEMEAAGPRAR